MPQLPSPAIITLGRPDHQLTCHFPSTDDPDYEKHKEDSLAKQKQGKAHWKPELASDSEESVKADRSHGEPSDAESMKRLQERTKQAAEEKSKAGTSMRDGL